MSEHKHTEVKAPEIKRNDITKVLKEQVFGKQSDRGGVKFYAPVIDLTVEDDVKWAGIENLSGIVNKTLRKIFADLYVDNVNEETGVFDRENWEAQAADFTAGVAKLSDIEEQLDSLMAEQQSYALDPDFGATVDDSEGSPKTERAVEIEKHIREVANKIKPLRTQKAAIEVKYAAAALKRKDKEKNSKTKTEQSEPVKV